MAPEAITKRIYSEKSDSWSFGVLVRNPLPPPTMRLDNTI
jgi:hypothetical protein